jgi:hypothetical protein
MLNGNSAVSVIELDTDVVVSEQINCASAVFSGSPGIPLASGKTIAICKWIDASNFCVQMNLQGQQIGTEVEIIPEGGTITVFPANAGGAAIFLDGSSSISTATGIRLRFVEGQTASAWARIA